MRYSSKTSHPNIAAAKASTKMTNDEKVSEREPKATDYKPWPPEWLINPRAKSAMTPVIVAGTSDCPEIKTITNNTDAVTQVLMRVSAPASWVLRPTRMHKK